MDKAALIDAVQRNCHIADARHAGDYTLCIYLLKMREFYRWEQGLGFSQQPDNEVVGDWLTAREALWDSVDEEDYRSLPIHNLAYDPFALDSINAILCTQGLVYSAGYGRRCRPLFFLADLEQCIEEADYTLWIAGREWARDMEAPPAMSQGQSIFIRRESFKRFLWEKVEDWRWRGAEHPFHKAFSAYEFEHNVEAGLEALLQAELPFVVAHEVGEIKAGQLLGEAAWQALLYSLPTGPLDYVLRAIRDSLADALQTIPTLVQQGTEANWHFYFAHLSPLRKQWLGSLLATYQTAQTQADPQPLLLQWAASEVERWLEWGQKALALYERQGKQAAPAIEQLIKLYSLPK